MTSYEKDPKTSAWSADALRKEEMPANTEAGYVITKYDPKPSQLSELARRSRPLTVGAMEDILAQFKTDLSSEVEEAMVKALTRVFGKQKQD